MKDRKKSILIVEDLENWCEVFSSILQDEYDVQVTRSYEEAIQVLQDSESSFELIIVDIRLVDEDVSDRGGLRLLEGVSKRKEYISTIVVTAYPRIETAMEAMRDFGAFDYIEKYPADGEFNIAQFRDIVSEAIDNTAKRRAIAPKGAESAIS